MDIVGRLTSSLADRYLIERELGQGGMATVYLAHDVRHDRKVALKVLRPELAAILGGERFLHEIRTTANLQHPHILPLHDSGEVDGTVFYVMPFVDGESLRDRLSRDKQLPLDDAVRISREVADALAYAHEKGVVHRDIKPENILLHGGHAMVADFGIALAVSTVGGGTRMTETGMSLGTPHYMAPEQAMGDREITPRADIYALGCVTYEMLTGEPPFTGSTAQAIVARVVTENPRSLTSQRHTIPPHVEAVVLKALEKLPADRFATAKEFVQALDNPSYLPATRIAAAYRASEWRSRVAVPAMAVAVVLTAFAGWGLVKERPPELRPIIRFTINAPAEGAFSDATGSPIAVSPDGSRMVYLGRTGQGRSQLFLRPFDQMAATAMTGTVGATQPFFSPDGNWIGFLQDGKLRKVPVGGGGAITLADAPNVLGATWSDDDHIVYSVSGVALLRLSAAGGVPETLLTDSAAPGIVWPHMLPGSKVVVFARRIDGAFSLWRLRIGSREPEPLDLPGSFPRYAGPGWLTYGTLEGSLFAIPFDGRRTTGEPLLIAEGVRVGSGGAGKYGISAAGDVVFLSGSGSVRDLVEVDRQGRRSVLPMAQARFEGPRYSPDGRRIAVGIGDVLSARSSIWLYALSDRTMSRLTFDSASVYPEWSSDGQWVIYSARGTGTDYDLRRVRVDGSGVAESLLVKPGAQWEGVAGPRGLVYRESKSNSDRDLFFLPAGGTDPVTVAATPFDERAPALSPDGAWVAYTSNETGANQVYVRPVPGPGGRLQVSAGGGMDPRWSARGQLFFRTLGDSVGMADLVFSGGEARLARRQTVYVGPGLITLGGNHGSWDVHPGGQKFLFVQTTGGANDAEATAILNWFSSTAARRR